MMKPFCVGVDWGTSRFRLWVMNVDGTVIAERESDEGLQQSGKIGFETVLEAHLEALNVAPELPVIICGMAGSASGWHDAGYSDTPVDIGVIAEVAVKVKARRDVRILGGIAQRSARHPDVMRGEETQLLGLARQGRQADLVCLPGTHSKWVDFRDNQVRQFATFMSGEMFAILSQHSILSLTMAAQNSATRQILPDDKVFLAAVEQAVEAPAEVGNQLFAARPAILLGLGQEEQSAAKLSGALIGLEIAGARSRFGEIGAVCLVVSGQLGALYASALTASGISVHPYDGAELVRTGLLEAGRALWR